MSSNALVCFLGFVIFVKDLRKERLFLFFFDNKIIYLLMSSNALVCFLGFVIFVKVL